MRADQIPANRKCKKAKETIDGGSPQATKQGTGSGSYVSQMPKQFAETEQRLDDKCWKGYKKQGTKIKGGVRVNNCVKIGESWELTIDTLIKLLESK